MSLIKQHRKALLLTVIFSIFGSDLEAAENKEPLQERIEALGQVVEIRLQADQSLKEKALSNLSEIITSWNQLEEPNEKQRAELNDWISRAMSALMKSRVDWMPAPIHFKQEAKPILSTTTPKKKEFTEETFTDYLKRKRNSVSNQPKQQSKATHIQRKKAKPQRVAKPTIGQPPLNETSPRKSRNKDSVVQTKPQRSKWSKHPSSAPLEWNDPFKDDPVESNKTDELLIEREALRPMIDGSAYSENASGVVVNQLELSASIRDYNLAIRDIRIRLARKNQMRRADLIQIGAELNRLESDLDFISLYYKGLSDIDRMMLPNIESAELATQIVSRRVEEQLSESRSNGSEYAALRKIHQQLSKAP